jgi:hypothetical protein
MILSPNIDDVSTQKNDPSLAPGVLTPLTPLTAILLFVFLKRDKRRRESRRKNNMQMAVSAVGAVSFSLRGGVPI